MSPTLLLFLLSAIAILARGANIGVSNYTPNIALQGYTITKVFPTTMPLDDVFIFAEAYPTGYIELSATLGVFPANFTNTEFPITITGVQVTDGTPVNLHLYTNSSDPSFQGFDMNVTISVFATCGLIAFNGSDCPAVGEFVYYSGSYQRPFDTYDAVFNVTVLDGIGFQIYFNAGTSCPSETSNTLTTSSADYATLAYLLTGGSGSSTEFDFTIGMMRVNASLPCEFTMYAFDGKNASLSTPPNMVCTQPLVALTQCNAAAFPQWEIIVIAVCGGVGLIFLVAILYFIVKYRRDKK